MRIAKTLAMLFALVLVVICFNAPVLYSGEEHPWDGDGSGDGTDGSVIDSPNDTLIIIPGADDDTEDGSIYDPDDLDITELLFNVQYFLQFYSIPGSANENSGASSSTN